MNHRKRSHFAFETNDNEATRPTCRHVFGTEEIRRAWLRLRSLDNDGMSSPPKDNGNEEMPGWVCRGMEAWQSQAGGFNAAFGFKEVADQGDGGRGAWIATRR